MTSNRRKVQYRNRSFWVTIPPALAVDKGIQAQSYIEWRSFPLAGDDWERIRKEHPNALVMIPVDGRVAGPDNGHDNP